MLLLKQLQLHYKYLSSEAVW